MGFSIYAKLEILIVAQAIFSLMRIILEFTFTRKITHIFPLYFNYFCYLHLLFLYLYYKH